MQLTDYKNRMIDKQLVGYDGNIFHGLNVDWLRNKQSYTLLYNEPSSRPSSKSSLFLNLK